MKRKFRKLTAGIVSAVLILSMLPVAALTANAVDYPGDWMVYRNPGDYKDPTPGEEPFYKPAPGFEYTDEGFRTIPADYTNTSPFFTVQTKDSQYVKDGIYLDLRVDEYSYGGDNHADHWISFSIWDRQNLDPGTTWNGSGWLCLLRGEGEGANAPLETFFTTAETEEKGGSFVNYGNTTVKPILDEQGKEHYVLSIAYTDNAYVITVNEVVVPGLANVTKRLNELDPDGNFYIGISLHSGQKNGVGSVSIVKYGTSRETATVPAGSDRREPDENVNVVGDPIDPSTVPVNQPALLFDATGSSYSGELKGQNMIMTPQGDNSIHMEANEATGSIAWIIRRSVTYQAEDFPVFAMLLRNYWMDGGQLYYCSGDIVSTHTDASTSWSLYDDGCDTYGENGEYALVVVDLNACDNWSGRIESLWPFFQVSDPADPETNNFDLMYMGMFRSMEEAAAYTENYLGIDPDAAEDSTTAEPEDTAAPEETTTVPADTTAAPADTTAAPVETSAPAATTAAETTAEKKGCGSVVGMGAGAALLAAAALAVALKKKH